MNEYAYPVQMEVSGSTAMFTRPDTGSSPVSYPVPTYSAVKGIFEAVLLLQQAVVIPTRVEICAPVVYHHYTTNYLGPARQPGKEGAFMLPATVLTDVCYRLYAVARHDDRPLPHSNHGKADGYRTTNGGHAYQAIFNRRLKRGQCYRTPCLGWKEFTVDYFGEFRERSAVRTDVNLSIPLLFKSFTPDGRGKSPSWNPVFTPDVEVREGRLDYV